MHTVLVVDDKEMLRDSVGVTLRRAGMNVLAAPNGRAALDQIARKRPDVVVSDLKMPGMTGIELLEQVRGIDEDLPFVLMTAFGAIETAVEAMRLGAFDYLTKPFEGDELIIAVKRAVEHARVVRENAILRRSPGTARVGTFAEPGAGPSAGHGTGGGGGGGGGQGASGLDRIIGESAAMRRVKEQVLAVAESAGTVLICGESGTGKEVVAQAVHDLSPRRADPFLAVNCAALSESLLESELFGHEKGAFTGAERARKGRFELADRGTLLLDEISEVSTRVQAKLLRVLQERAFERVGSSLTIGVDVRVVATSNRDLPRTVARGEFRQDLFFRLNVLPIHLPPLRDRVEDLPRLAEHFVRIASERDGRVVKRFEDGALEALAGYGWPGNVRELQNICERAVVLASGPTITRSLVEPWLGTSMAAPAAPPATAHIPIAVPAPAAPQQLDTPMIGIAAAGQAPALHAVSRPAPGPVQTASAPVRVAGAPFASAVEPKSGFGAVPVLGRQLEDIERDAIVQTLNQYQGHRQKAAIALGIGVRTLGLKLKKWKELNLVEQTL